MEKVVHIKHRARRGLTVATKAHTRFEGIKDVNGRLENKGDNLSGRQSLRRGVPLKDLFWAVTLVTLGLLGGTGYSKEKKKKVTRKNLTRGELSCLTGSDRAEVCTAIGQ